MALVAAVILVVAVGLVHSSVLMILSIRNRIYQKKWDKEKIVFKKTNPKASKAELCEYFVIFCLRNDCKVNF